MNKYKDLTKQTAVTAAIAFGVVAVFSGIYFLASNYATSAATRKNEAEGAFGRDQSQIASLRNQLEKSGDAEKRFVDIQLARANLDFTANSDMLKDWLRDAKSRYRFSNASKLKVSTEKPTDKADLSGLDYAVTMRPAMQLEIQAISDVHVFSFINEFQKQAPGLIRLTSLSLKRKGDLDPGAIDQISRGYAAYLVDANMEFTWIGIAPKDTKANPAGGR